MSYLEKELSPTQYQLIKFEFQYNFYHHGKDDWKEYEYTELEAETLETAIENIRKSKYIKNAINLIMDCKLL